MQLNLNNLSDTQQLAVTISHLVQPGDAITLDGELGAGKTTFTKALVAQLAPNERVTSPTFNIMQSYQGTDFPIYHFDAYRLEMVGGEDQGFEEFIGTDGVALIEWPQFIETILPADVLAIRLMRTDDSDQQRKANIQSRGQRSQVLLEQIELAIHD